MRQAYQALGICLFLQIIAPAQSWGLQKPKLIVIDWFNEENNPHADYLSASITEAVVSELHKKFVFELMPQKDWQASARENQIQKEDLATATAALQLGTWNAQSVVISGKYRLKKNGARQTMQVDAALYSIPETRRALQFSEELPLSSDMFGALNKMAERFADKAKNLLPSEETYRLAEIREFEAMRNYLAFRPGMVFFGRPAQQQNLLVSSVMSPSDFPLQYGGNFEYRRFGIWKHFLGVYANAGGHYGTANLTGRGTAIPGTVFDIHGAAGLLWHFGFNRKFYLVPQLGAGYQYGQIILKGQASPIYNQTIVDGTVFAEARLNFGYFISRRVAIEIAPLAYTAFYSGLTSVMVGFDIAGVWKF